MIDPNLSEYVLVVEETNRAYIRHAFKHSGFCTHRDYVATISGNALEVPVDTLVRRVAEHDAECPLLRAERWDPPPPVPSGGSMKAFVENWPAAREVIAVTGYTAAEAKAAGEQVMAAWKAAMESSAEQEPTS